MTRTAWLLALLLLVLTAPARASVVLQYDFDQLVAEADAIVHARVVSLHSYWLENTIVTRVELAVLDCPKGGYTAGQTLVVEQAGGVVGDLAMLVPGEASFATGEEVVVFLEENAEAGAPLVLGMSQGKFTVEADATGTPVVTRSLEGIELVAPDGALRDVPLTRPTPVLPDGPELSARIREQVLAGPVQLPLDAFLTEIERTLAREESY